MLGRDAAKLDFAVQNRVHRIGHIVLMHFAQAPASDVKVLVIKAEVDVSDQAVARRRSPLASLAGFLDLRDVDRW